MDKASDADMSLSGSFLSSIVEENASCGGRQSGDCCIDFDLGVEGDEVTFDPDYVWYCGIPYVDAKVSFFKSFIEVSSNTIYGNNGTFHFVLEIENIIKIESQWSARFNRGTISISFISKDAEKVDSHQDSSASGIKDLVFPATDSDWYLKLESIESLDEKYRALWNVLLDTGVDQSSVFPEQGSTLPRRSYLPNFDRPFEEVIYPKGDPDAVSISKRDVDLLLPDTFVNDTIIDFYIKYLKTKQNAEEKSKFHFFNSFFFRKLADVDKDPSSLSDGRAAFLRVRKWTRKVNLDEKDFIFIPVNYNYHWSLIVICYFSEVANYSDSESKKSARVPCILHMDSLKGTHVGLKDLFQSYLLEEWKERHDGSCDDIQSKFCNLKFVSLELPQQQNAYDCGLFLLHYVELFLDEIPPDFSIYNVTASTKFLQSNWFPPLEASLKRTEIQRIISNLLDIQTDNFSPPGVGMDCCPEDLKTTHECENIVNDPTNSVCWRDDGQGIEMTLLPSSSGQCTGASGLILSELSQPTSAPHSFDSSAWEAFDVEPSLDEIRRPPILTGDNAECLVSTESNGPVFQHSNDDRNPSGGFIPEESSSEAYPVQLLVAEGVENSSSYHETCQFQATLSTSSCSEEQQASKRLRIADIHQNGEDHLV